MVDVFALTNVSSQIGICLVSTGGNAEGVALSLFMIITVGECTE